MDGNLSHFSKGTTMKASLQSMRGHAAGTTIDDEQNSPVGFQFGSTDPQMH
jgi:hypothetical protein